MSHLTFASGDSSSTKERPTLNFRYHCRPLRGGGSESLGSCVDTYFQERSQALE